MAFDLFQNTKDFDLFGYFKTDSWFYWLKLQSVYVQSNLVADLRFLKS